VAARSGTEPPRLSAAAFAQGSEITLHDLPDELREAALTSGFVHSAARGGLTLAEMEAAYIAEILRRTGGNKKRAAQVLGIPRRTLYRRLEEHGIAPARDAAEGGAGG
jgi:transcriptional regulator of acetoin/glycerol metabolism